MLLIGAELYVAEPRRIPKGQRDAEPRTGREPGYGDVRSIASPCKRAGRGRLDVPEVLEDDRAIVHVKIHTFGGRERVARHPGEHDGFAAGIVTLGARGDAPQRQLDVADLLRERRVAKNRE